MATAQGSEGGTEQLLWPQGRLGGLSHPSTLFASCITKFSAQPELKGTEQLRRASERLEGWLNLQYRAAPLELLLELRTRGVLQQGREALGSQVTCPCHPTSSVTPQSITVTTT